MPDKITAHKSWAELMEEFIIARGDTVPDLPIDLPDDIKVLRLRLMYEELAELTIALHENQCEDLLDAICDTLYTVVGTAVAAGFGPILDQAFREVHRSNLTKNLSGSKSSEKSGKKGTTYEPPELQKIILQYIK